MDRYNSYRPGPASGSGYGSRDNRRDYNQYDRPPPPVYDDRPPPPPPDSNMYHFRGAADRARDHYAGDSYRPSGQSYGGDSYRPGGNDRRDDGRGFDFNFQSGSGPSFAPTTDYPSARRPARSQRERADRGRNARGRGGRGRPRFAGPSDRALLRTEKEPTPEQMEGMNNGHSRFKALGNMSDSDSEDMDLSDGSGPVRPAVPMDDSESEDDHPRAKRARLQSPEPVQEQTKPKWSNPDPYTALPPPDESQTKKKDVVKLIRKAKVEAEKAASTSNAASDFISLNFDDDDDGKPASESGEVSSELSSDNEPTVPHAPPGVPQKGINMALPAGRLDVWPPPPPGLDTAVQKQASVDTTAKARNANKGKKRKNLSHDLGSIIEEWAPPGDADPTPWLNIDASAFPTLQQEILDFYDYVKPRDFEEQVRHSLVQRIQGAISNRFPQAQVMAFGSFASGLYLPTADMDLVAVTSEFMTRGIPRIVGHGQMRKFANCLVQAGIVRPGSLTVISGARVPIIKLVDNETGLRVDVSFENNSGLTAQKTFENWKALYPAMPPIVSLIKQFLVMRGLSEVFTGGLGGYSIICLVVSCIRSLLKKKGADWDQMQHLDHILMDFLIYYGDEFNRYTTGIQMEPWSLISKNHYNPRGGKRSKPDRLLIVDPNKFENDISGGTSEIGVIFEAFFEASKDIGHSLDHAEQVWEDNKIKCSILEPVWGGNYGLFEIQRARLKTLWDAQTRPADFPRGVAAPPAPRPATTRAEAQAPSSKRQKKANSGAGTKQSPIDVDIDTEHKSSNAASSFKPINAPKAPKDRRTRRNEAANKQAQEAFKANVPESSKDKSKDSRTKKEENKDDKRKRASRATAFKQQFPGVPCPTRLSKAQFKELKQKVKADPKK